MRLARDISRFPGYGRQNGGAGGGGETRQTREAQVLVPERACGFDSHPPHQVRLAMRPKAEVDLVLSLLAEGKNHRQISRETGIPRRTIQTWAAGRIPRGRPVMCLRCARSRYAFTSVAQRAYVYQRVIKLASWQHAICDRFPRQLVRGLIHSDGCRSMNTIRHPTKTYAYPRYQFSNRSDDIRGIFCEYCDQVGVEWRR